MLVHGKIKSGGITLNKTLFDKLWDLHIAGQDGTGAAFLAIDRVFLHERTGGVALKTLQESGRMVKSPSQVFCVMDHIVSFAASRGRDDARFPGGDVFITETRAMAEKSGIRLIDTDDPKQGIVHVIAPELGVAVPGVSIVCPDSHTCSLGALGALAIGVGSSEVEHAMVTGVIRAAKPKQMKITVTGALQPDVTAKDLALHVIATHGAGGGQRMAVEYCGEAIDALDIEARLTLCNMAVEFAAYTVVISPDEKVIDFVDSRPFAPAEKHWEHALAHWRELKTDPGAVFDHENEIEGSTVRPMVTWGTSPEQAAPVTEGAPVLNTIREDKVGSAKSALAYAGLKPGDKFEDMKIDGAFIGSCTNGRLSDLRAAASVLKGRRIADGVRAICVPGSMSVRAAAETEGLDEVFKAAGFEWGASGCAMCFYAGGETFPPQSRIISSTNRNFEGRQGPGVRTHLASPATVAASAVAGRIIGADQLSKFKAAS